MKMPTSFWGYCTAVALVCFAVNLAVVSVVNYVHDTREVECDMCGNKDEMREMRDVCGYLLCPHCRHYAASIAANATWFVEQVRLEDVDTEEIAK